MSFRHALAALAVVAGLGLGPVQAFVASNGLLVQRVNETDFFVPFRGRPAATSFWCAAGDFVIRGLDLRPGTRVFRLSPPPRRGATASFSRSVPKARRTVACRSGAARTRE